MPRLLRRLVYRRRLIRIAKSRYRHLLETVYRRRCRTLLEIGTYDGVHARQMIETAGIFHPIEQVEYYGFDLFERLTDHDLDREFSKKPPPAAEVARRLEETGAQVRLFIGYTSETLPAFVQEITGTGTTVDFVFIDGGHSIETIAADWEQIRKAMTAGTVVLFDDYYTNTEPQVRAVGCQHLINSLNRQQYDVEILGPEDHFEKDWGTLKVRMARVTLRSG